MPLTPLIRDAPSRYARAFLYTESDGNDATYFLLYHLELIQRAISSLRANMRREMANVRAAERALRPDVSLNHRQQMVISNALRHPSRRDTIRSHQGKHSVAYQTARTDLVDLADRGVLEQHRQGKAFFFTVPSDLQQRLAAL